MADVLKLWLLLIVALRHKILIKCEPDWNYDLVSVNVDNNTPDIVDIELHRIRVARGIFAFGGYIDFKEDITDASHLICTTYYSQGGSYFIKTAFGIYESNLTTIMNKFYKDFVMDSLVACTDNAPLLEGTFVAPLTKRIVHLNNCLMSNKNMPSKLKSGYYKIIFHYTNYGEGTIEVLIKVEQD